MLRIADQVETKRTVVFYVEPLGNAIGAEGMNALFELAGVFLGSEANRADELFEIHA